MQIQFPLAADAERADCPSAGALVHSVTLSLPFVRTSAGVVYSAHDEASLDGRSESVMTRTVRAMKIAAIGLENRNHAFPPVAAKA